MPPVTDGARPGAADIRRLCGDLLDWKVAAILATDASQVDIEAAMAWLEGESDVMGEERRPLAGRSAAVYDLLVRADEFPDDEGAARP
jgi:hypothetical protein